MGDRRVIHLVDDEEAIRKAASFALKTADYDVRTFVSGVEFLKKSLFQPVFADLWAIRHKL